MSTRLYSVVFDSAEFASLGRWWADALGWRIGFESDDEIAVVDPDDEALALVFVPVDDPKTVKNRIHLDLASRSVAERDQIVDRLLAAGATHADVGQGPDVSWVVLTDPEGNEFCVLGPSGGDRDRSALASVVLDAHDQAATAQFWHVATGWTIGEADADGDIPMERPDGRGPRLDILGVPDAKAAKNRVHLDVAPWASDDQAAEVARLVAAGATRVDVGQGPDVSWVVLADPEGNELCVLSPRDD